MTHSLRCAGAYRSKRRPADVRPAAEAHGPVKRRERITKQCKESSPPKGGRISSHDKTPSGAHLHTEESLTLTTRSEDGDRPTAAVFTTFHKSQLTCKFKHSGDEKLCQLESTWKIQSVFLRNSLFFPSSNKQRAARCVTAASHLNLATGRNCISQTERVTGVQRLSRNYLIRSDSLI